MEVQGPIMERKGRLVVSSTAGRQTHDLYHSKNTMSTSPTCLFIVPHAITASQTEDLLLAGVEAFEASASQGFSLYF